MEKEGGHRLDVDKHLSTIGKFGLFQFVSLTLGFGVVGLIGASIMSVVFTSASPDFRYVCVNTATRHSIF